jgi:hypothetical protein
VTCPSASTCVAPDGDAFLHDPGGRRIGQRRVGAPRPSLPLDASHPSRTPFPPYSSFGFLGYGALTWLYFSAALHRTLARVLALGSASAILVGLTAVVNSLYLARVTGDWEAYVTIFGFVLGGHGAVFTAYLRRGERALGPSSTTRSSIAG